MKIYELKEALIEFFKKIPLFIWIILFIGLTFVFMLLYTKYEQDISLKKIEMKKTENNQVNKLLEKSIVSTENKIFTGVDVGQGVKENISLEKLKPLNAITMKFSSPIVMQTTDFEKVGNKYQITKAGALKLKLEYTGELISHINSFVNNTLSNKTDINFKSGFSFSFDKNFNIISRKVPEIKEREKYDKLQAVLTLLLKANSDKKDFVLQNLIIKLKDLPAKINEIQIALGKISTIKIQKETKDFNGKNIIEVTKSMNIE